MQLKTTAFLRVPSANKTAFILEKNTFPTYDSHYIVNSSENMKIHVKSRGTLCLDKQTGDLGAKSQESYSWSVTAVLLNDLVTMAGQHCLHIQNLVRIICSMFVLFSILGLFLIRGPLYLLYYF